MIGGPSAVIDAPYGSRSEKKRSANITEPHFSTCAFKFTLYRGNGASTREKISRLKGHHGIPIHGIFSDSAPSSWFLTAMMFPYPVGRV